MNLYEVLGVKCNASAKTIQKAYRRLAMQHHPDRGGDRVAFEQVQFAYDVLMDPVRRSRYDATGDVSSVTVDPVEQQALVILSTTLAQTVMATIGPLQSFNDLLENMRQSVREAIASAKEAYTSAEKIEAALRAQKGKFSIDGENLLDTMLDAHLLDIARQRKAFTQSIDAHTRALEMLSKYRYAATTARTPFWPRVTWVNV